MAGGIHFPRPDQICTGLPAALTPGWDDPASPQFVVTRRGLGYYFNA
nr:hypothetical protein [uncultured Flavonifractor sp.]